METVCVLLSVVVLLSLLMNRAKQSTSARSLVRETFFPNSREWDDKTGEWRLASATSSSDTSSSDEAGFTTSGILYINLDIRMDRKKEIMQELTTVPEHMIQRIRAVYDAECGHIGCGRSHVVALQLAIEKNWDSVLILEDDFFFESEMRLLNESLTNCPDSWDVFMLAGGFVDSTPVGKNLERVNRATTTSGYIVRRHYYKTILECFQEAVFRMEMDLNEFRKTNPYPKKMFYTNNAIDQIWFKLQEKDQWYISSPRIGSQGRSSSSIMSN